MGDRYIIMFDLWIYVSVCMCVDLSVCGLLLRHSSQTDDFVLSKALLIECSKL